MKPKTFCINNLTEKDSAKAIVFLEKKNSLTLHHGKYNNTVPLQKMRYILNVSNTDTKYVNY